VLAGVFPQSIYRLADPPVTLMRPQLHCHCDDLCHRWMKCHVVLICKTVKVSILQCRAIKGIDGLLTSLFLPNPEAEAGESCLMTTIVVRRNAHFLLPYHGEIYSIQFDSIRFNSIRWTETRSRF
jgi:hypothetical protein